MRTIIRDNYDPTPNEYHETIVVDEAREKRWLFDCDGVYHDITKVNVVSERGDSEEYAASQKWVTDEVEALEAADQALQDNIDAEETARIAADETLQDNIDAEEADRIAADTEIWDEIEAIEAASDVVDIVGTYAELQQYDTSALKDNDIIKVLADETHDDAIAYYRWSTSTESFSFVGVEGPYYTASETDALLADKQDKLIAGSNIQIAADGKTISATDTTYTAGANVQISANNEISATDTTYDVFDEDTDGLVPGPTAAEISAGDKFLNADGTWQTVQGGGGTVTVLYQDPSQSTPDTFYKDTTYTDAYTIEEVVAAYEAGKVYVVDKWGQMTEVVYALRSRGNGRLRINRSNGVLNEFEGALSGTTYTTSTQTLQDAIQAGAHIYISGGGKTINATFNDFTGATSSVAGANGLVPAPAAGDEGKFLKGDGTWATVSSGSSYTAGNGIDIDSNNEISVDTAVVATQTDLAGKQDTLTAGTGINIDANNVISAVTNNISSTDWNTLWQ